jgi:hypothetical protein
LDLRQPPPQQVVFLLFSHSEKTDESVAVLSKRWLSLQIARATALSCVLPHARKLQGLLSSTTEISKSVSASRPPKSDGCFQEADQDAHQEPWRRVLYLKQNFPDNYTDSSFLEKLQMNCV